MGGGALKDSYGRTIDYMRVSVTNKCNLRCLYCMPGSCSDSCDMLSVEDILTVCSCAAELGIRHIKLTGGEPLLRRDCAELVYELKRINGIRTVTLTTNGILLKKYADKLFDSGIDGINVSLDTLDREKYKYITGADELYSVIDGIQRAEERGIFVKINSVIMRGINEDDISSILLFVKHRPVVVRFIELMPVGEGSKYIGVSGADILEKLGNAKLYTKRIGSGPAVYYNVEGYRGIIGFIDPMSNKFCHKCSRLRLDCEGRLRSCLAYDDGFDMLPAIKTGREAVKDVIKKAVAEKPLGHCFEKGVAPKDGMYCIGG